MRIKMSGVLAALSGISALVALWAEKWMVAFWSVVLVIVWVLLTDD